MDAEKKLAILQNTYAASLSETVNTYAWMGTLEAIVAAKAERQAQTAPAMLAMLGIKSPDGVFSALSEVFGCANWQVHKIEAGFEATATSCKLCALSKKMGGANPCRGWCLDPMEAMVKALAGGAAGFVVKSTLMNGDVCRVEVTGAGDFTQTAPK